MRDPGVPSLLESAWKVRLNGRLGDLDELDGGIVVAEAAAEGEEEDGGARDVGRVVEVARPEGRHLAPGSQAQAPPDRVRLSRARKWCNRLNSQDQIVPNQGNRV